MEFVDYCSNYYYYYYDIKVEVLCNILPSDVHNFNLDYKNLIERKDILGKETSIKKNNIYFDIYDDGTVEKKIIIE